MSQGMLNLALSFYALAKQQLYNINEFK